MSGEVNLSGLYIPWLMVLALGTWPVLWVVRRLLAATGFYRWVWHPPLFDTALYVLLLFVLSRTTAFLQ